MHLLSNLSFDLKAGLIAAILFLGKALHCDIPCFAAVPVIKMFSSSSTGNFKAGITCS